MMRYLCLVFGDAPLASVDRCVTAAAIEPLGAAATVRVRNGRLMVTDGPVAATTESLGAFILVEARDLNDAIRIASQMSAARGVSVEVRPIRPRATESVEGSRS